MSRGQHRRIHVTKAGPLHVDGKQVSKGNLPQQTKRVVRSMNRQLARTSQPGPIASGSARDLLGGDPETHCEWCGRGAWGDEQVLLEQETGRWWHGPEKRYPGQQATPPTCRRKWVLAGGDA